MAGGCHGSARMRMHGGYAWSRARAVEGPRWAVLATCSGPGHRLLKCASEIADGYTRTQAQDMKACHTARGWGVRPLPPTPTFSLLYRTPRAVLIFSSRNGNHNLPHGVRRTLSSAASATADRLRLFCRELLQCCAPWPAITLAGASASPPQLSLRAHRCARPCVGAQLRLPRQRPTRMQRSSPSPA